MESFALGHAKFLSVMPMVYRIEPSIDVTVFITTPDLHPTGVNPRGLKALELWQTNVTQVTEFGWLKYVHVTVDTSSAMWVSAHTGEKARDVIAHWKQAFAILGIPSAVKTDNGPAYASQKGNANLQLSLDSYSGQISVHAPSHKSFNKEFHLILLEKRSRRPLKALTVFTDESGASHKLVMTWRNPQTQHWEADVEFVEGSPQVAELAAVMRAFEKFSEQINLVTNSAYVAG
ncbi:hypothetical protein DUI87_01241 [Hirundo rustica rustica]|uniref:Uncharacterized protein n=1 Tax=Hirundo rustica rustica TaxID=333673 RepID=A0A3M0L443_HIRRU|nr:hypothetical protein DUI87_01241 [Hirundo rustica rustica]